VVEEPIDMLDEPAVKDVIVTAICRLLSYP